jgi:GNAT superfamily N-acetyltransferase
MTVTYHTLGGAQAVDLFDRLAGLYAVVYAEPPYEESPEQVDRFRAGLPQEAARPGFTLVVALDDGKLVGAAYGWTMPAGTWWSRADRPPPGDLATVEKLAVMEWIVHPDRRGEGVGLELMRRLLTGRPEGHATLASDPRSAARGMYERAGWRQVGRSTLPWDGGPAMDLLVLELPASPVQLGGDGGVS